MIYVRVRGIGGYWQSHFNNDPAEHMASDFPDLYGHFAHEGFSLKSPGRTRNVSDLDEWAESIIQDAADAGLREVREFVGEELTDAAREFLGARESIVGWMRKGFRRAYKRYADVPSWRACEAFMEIERRADEALKRCEAYADAGVKVVFSVNVKGAKVSVSFPGWEDYF